MLRSVPRIIIAAPADAEQLRDLMYTASLGGYGSAFVIRYPRGGEFDMSELTHPLQRVEIGKSRLLNQGDARVVVLSLGDLTARVTELVEELKPQGINFTHYDLRFAKPLDTAMLDGLPEDTEWVVTLENGVRDGGVGSAILEYLSQSCPHIKVKRLGVGDSFMEQASACEQHAMCGIDKESIEKTILELISK